MLTALWCLTLCSVLCVLSGSLKDHLCVSSFLEFRAHAPWGGLFIHPYSRYLVNAFNMKSQVFPSWEVSCIISLVISFPCFVFSGIFFFFNWISWRYLLIFLNFLSYVVPVLDFACFCFYFLQDFLNHVQVWDWVRKVRLKPWVQNLNRHQETK